MSGPMRLAERPGGGALVIATVMEPGASAIEGAIAGAAQQGVDAVEIRFDAAPGVDPAAIGSSARIPLVATCRPRSQGGLFEGSEEERSRILERAALTGRFLLDTEHGTAAARLVAGHPEWAGVLSHHEAGDAAPVRDSAEGRRMRALAIAMLGAAPPGCIVKLITTASRATDLLVIRELLRSLGASRLAAFAMGEPGLASRVLAGAWGSAAVWAAARPDLPGAPGQIGARALMELYRFRSVSAATRVFGIAGSPIRHSLSPLIHNTLFERLGLDAVYVPIECGDSAELARLARGLPLDGVSVTAPLKVSILGEIDDLDSSARQAGACNTLVREPCPSAGAIAASSGERPRFRGFNTDGPAALEEIRARIDPAGRVAVIAGAGGAAAAVGFALKAAGARLVVANRGIPRGSALARRLGALFVPLDQVHGGTGTIVIQATSAPREDPVLPEAALSAAFVLDLRYGPSETATVAEALRRGSPAADGLGMLSRQAAAQARLFTGSEPSLDWIQAVLGERAGAGVSW